MSSPRRYLAPLAAVMCLQAVLSFAYLRRAAHLPEETLQLEIVDGAPSNEPPLYYSLARTFVAPLEGRSAAARTNALRFLNLLLGLATMGFVYLFAMRVAGERSAVYCAGFSAFLPQHLFVTATLGPDELGAALSTAALWLGARHLYKRRRAWLGPATGLALGLALLARASAWSTAFAFALCAGIQARKDPRGPFRLIVAPLSLALLVGAWPYGRRESFVPSASDFSMIDAAWLVRLARGFVALFGGGASEIPPMGYALAWVALAAGLVSFASWEHREKPWKLEPSWHLALAALGAGAAWAFMEAVASRGPDGRLLLSAMGPLSLVFIQGWRAFAWPLDPSTRQLLRGGGVASLLLLHYWSFLAL